MKLWYSLNDDGTTAPLADGQYPTMADIGNRRVAETTVANLWVSTVFLGLDHSYLNGPPLLFETMAFPNQKDLRELLCWRYSTKEQAEAGHAFLVAALEAGTSIDEIEQPDGAS